MYKIIKNSTRFKLESAVNDHIREGWKPIGGFVYIEKDPENVTNGCSYCQTLIRDLNK